MEANALYTELNQFTGLTALHRHWLPRFHYTEGVRFLAERTRCYWLIDLIAILQLRAWKDAWLRPTVLARLEECVSNAPRIQHRTNRLTALLGGVYSNAVSA